MASAGGQCLASKIGLSWSELTERQQPYGFARAWSMSTIVIIMGQWVDR